MCEQSDVRQMTWSEGLGTPCRTSTSASLDVRNDRRLGSKIRSLKLSFLFLVNFVEHGGHEFHSNRNSGSFRSFQHSVFLHGCNLL